MISVVGTLEPFGVEACFEDCMSVNSAYLCCNLMYCDKITSKCITVIGFEHRNRYREIRVLIIVKPESSI